MPEDRTREVGKAAAITAAAGSAVALAALIGRAPRRATARSGGTGGPGRTAGAGADVGASGDAGGNEGTIEKADAPSPDASGKPEGPEDLHKRAWTFALRKVLREFSKDHCTDLAASLVYYSVLALFPGLLAIVSLLGLFGQAQTTLDTVIGILRGISPDIAGTLEPIVRSLVTAPAAPLTFVIGVLGALWSASGYVGAFGRAMNRIYEVDEGRPVWKLRPTQLAVTAAVVILVVLGGLILVLSGSVAEAVGNAIGLSDAFVFVFGIVKWPVLVAIAVAAVAILYYFSPNVQQPKFKWTSTGSILALVVWAVATLGFGFYVSNFSNYDKTYGSIAGVIVFLLWLWITNLVLLFGAEFDAEIERSRELQAGIVAEETVQLPPRDTRQTEKRAKQHEQDVARGRRLRESRGRDDG